MYVIYTSVDSKIGSDGSKHAYVSNSNEAQLAKEKKQRRNARKQSRKANTLAMTSSKPACVCAWLIQ